MKIKRLLTVACSLFVAAASNAQGCKICTHIEGEVADTAVQVINVHRVDQNSSYIYTDTIPFANGRFSYDIHTAEPAVYSICAFNKDWIGRAVNFFADGDTVCIKFIPDDSPVWSSPSPLNKELHRVNGMTDSIFLHYQARFAKYADYDSLSESERKEYKALSDSYHGQIKAFRLGYMRKNPGLVGLFMLFEWGERFSDDSVAVREVASIYDDVYAGKFPGFHLSEYMKLWRASQSVKVGGHYIDFTAPDLAGNDHTLSEKIEGKVALIDFWASWCGPCRRLSKSMIPVYEKYKDRGFTIVGVARERDAEAMRKAIGRDKYPWLNLIELNDRIKLWNNYGMRGGGNKFLVDRDGTILAIDPKPEKLEAILKEKLK